MYTGFWRGLESFSSRASPTLKASKGADTEMSRLRKLTWFAAVQRELGKAQTPAGPREELSRCLQAAASRRLPRLEPEQPAFLGEAAETGYAGSSCGRFPPLSPSPLLSN